MTGWRVGWLMAPEAIITPLIGLNLVSTYGLNDFVSRAAVEALDRAIGVKEITTLYAGRRRSFAEAVRHIPGIEARGSQGGIYTMLDVRALCASGEDFAWSLLEAENLAVMPGESFGEATAGHIRISLCQPDAVLAEAARRIRNHAGRLLQKEKVQ